MACEINRILGARYVNSSPRPNNSGKNEEHCKRKIKRSIANAWMKGSSNTEKHKEGASCYLLNK